MGCYDYFDGICPHCSRPFYIQTKLFECEFQVIGVGKVDLDLINCRMKLKNNCEECDKSIVAVFNENGVLTNFEKDHPTQEELLYGSTNKI